MTMRRPAALAAAAVTVLALAGCGSSSPSSTAAAPPAQTPTPSVTPSGPTSSPTTSPTDGTPGTGATADAGTASAMSVRFANFYAQGTTPGPAVDIYDTPQYQAGTPIVTGLAYGAVSDYVTPHIPANSVDQSTIFYALPAGEDPVADSKDAVGIGGTVDDGSHPQKTFVLLAPSATDNTGGAPLAGLSNSSRIEKGTEGTATGPAGPPPPSGDGEILVDDSVTGGLLESDSVYLLDGGSCAAPVNGDPNEPGVPLVFTGYLHGTAEQFADFPVKPGTHQLSVEVWTSSSPPTCKQLKATSGSASVDVQAGQLVEVYVYGTSLKDLHLVAAPVQP